MKVATPKKLRAYGWDFPSGYSKLQIEFWFIKKGEKWLKLEGRSLFFHYRAAMSILWPTDDHHRWSDLILKTYCENEISVLLGCSDCVAGHTRIFNPVTGEQPTIQELCENQIAPMVMTLNGPAQAEIPFIKGEADLFEVLLSDGSRFFATAEHRVLSARGFCRVSDLRKGQSLFSYAPVHQESISELVPSIHGQGDLGSLKIVEGSLAGCHHEFRSCDEQLLLAREAARSSPPSRDDDASSFLLRVSQSHVVSVTKSHKASFYDITVPVAEHYFAEGAIHHNSSKTYTMSKIILVDYWAFPHETLWLVSTTEGRGSELRIWGCIKDLFNRAKLDGHDVAGKPIDYIKTITTDSIDDERELARSLRRGMVVIPCKTGGLASGLAPYIGIKAPRLRHAGDEVAVMSDSFLNAYSNWFGKEDFKGIMAGNFMETDDPLGIASEPIDGWDTFLDTGCTQTWKGKFYGAAVVALDGRDSPNFDQDNPEKPTYPYLIGHKKLNGVKSTKGTDSWEWYSQCVGKPVSGMDIWRVLSRNFCKQHGALDDVIWKGTPLTSIYGLDPAYGGGDLCVGRHIEFGEDLEGITRLRVGEPEIIPVSPKSKLEPEEQIASYIKIRLSQLNIPPRNCFYDSFGRGTLGFSFAQLFGAECPVPVDAGGSPSSRPVRFDMFVEEKNANKRLMRCDEYYCKFITELWFSVRESIETGQLKNLDAETMAEGCSRKFSKSRNNLIEVETKADMKERVGKSPNHMDNLAICVEGARQRGFKILRAGHQIMQTKQDDWLERFSKDYTEFHRSRRLANA